MAERRIYLDAKGRPEDLKQIANFEKQGARLVEQGSAEAREMLKKIDFEVLEEVFYEKFARPFGITNLNFLHPDRISGDVGVAGNPVAYYEPIRNRIDFSTKQLKELYDKFGDSHLPNALFLELLAHEESHAVSHTLCRGVQSWQNRSDSILERIFFPKTIEVESGYSHTRISQKRSRRLEFSKEELYEMFDEGVTQLMALEAVAPYMAKTGTEPELVNRFIQSRENYGPYAYEKGIVKEMIKIISNKSGVAEAEVRKAIIGGKLHGTKFDDDHDELFAEYFYPNFLADLAGLKLGREVTRLLLKLISLQRKEAVSERQLDTVLDQIEKE